jgi:hypothetical protein
MESTLVPVQPDSVFRDGASFDHINRVAKVFADSQLVPPTFQKNIANCIIGLEIAQRLGASPLMVMQNLNIIKGKPSFSATFMIAAVNSCGRFTPLDFIYVGERGTDEWGCYASTQNRQGKVLKGVMVTIGIAKKDGWYGRENSKWPTMPELMLMYRAATWWTRMYAPEMLMGFPTEDEVYDIKNVTNSAAEPEEKPAVSHKKGKGVNAMKQAAAAALPPEVKEPAKDTTAPVPGNLGEPAPAPPADQESSIANSAAREQHANEEPPVGKLSRVRCEITNLEEKDAKKKAGNGKITLVGLAGEWTGQAYFDGVKSKLPNVGAVIDVTLEERDHNNAKAYIVKSFEQVG